MGALPNQSRCWQGWWWRSPPRGHLEEAGNMDGLPGRDLRAMQLRTQSETHTEKYHASTLPLMLRTPTRASHWLRLPSFLPSSSFLSSSFFFFYFFRTGNPFFWCSLIYLEKKRAYLKLKVKNYWYMVFFLYLYSINFWKNKYWASDPRRLYGLRLSLLTIETKKDPIKHVSVDDSVRNTEMEKLSSETGVPRS